MNKLLVSTFVVWMAAELLKWALRLRKNRQAPLFHPGGMPSGHAAITSAVTTAAGLYEGFNSAAFAIGVILTAVVVHDAVRLRWAVGQQAGTINQLIKQTEPNQIAPVYVWHGHRIREVVAGVVFGTVGTLLLFYLVSGGNA